MKKISFLFLLILLCLSVFGQVSIGPKAGVNISKNRNDKYGGKSTDNRSVIGYNFGLVVHYWFSDNFVFQPEISYIQRGNQNIRTIFDDSTSNYTERKFTEKYNLLEVPLLIKYITGDKIKLNAIVGPAFSINTGGRYKLEMQTIDEYHSGKIRFGQKPENYTGDNLYMNPDYVTRFYYGFYVGLGLSKQVGRGKLMADARFGLNSYTSFKDGSQSEGYIQLFNKSFQILFFYVFDLNSSTKN